MESRSSLALALPLAVALVAIFAWWLGDAPFQPQNHETLVGDKAKPGADQDRIIEERRVVGEQSESLRDWFANWQARATVAEKESLLTEGLELASARGESLLRLMKTDPQAALEASLGWDEWVALPPEIQAVSEKPISLWVRQESMVSCDPESGKTRHELRLLTGAGDDWLTHSYDRRQSPLTRAGAPVQGFVLRGEAAVWPSAVRVVAGREAEVVRDLLPSIRASERVSVWSGADLPPGGGLTFVIGGRVGSVTDASELRDMRDRLHAWEDLPGEDGGAEQLLAWLENGTHTDGEFEPLASALPAPPVTNPWTETPKRLLLIRVDFPDLTGAREEESVLVEKLTQTISPVLYDYSFGKTNLIVTVTPEVFRMPQSGSYYPGENDAGNNGNRQLHDSAKDAAAAAGYVIDDYDFHCVQFKGIGMGYGGLANVGGKRSWIQSSGTSVFVHEFGHNYGVGHSSRWIPSVAGLAFDPSGTNDEYGGGSSTMGGGPFPDGHFDSQAKARLNWLNDDQIVEVTQSGRYRLYRADHIQVPGQGQVGALYISRPDGSGDELWIGHKRAIEYRRRLSRGVQVLWRKSASPNKNWLVQAGRVGSFADSDFELPTGQTFSDVSGSDSVHITPVERGGAAPAQWIDMEVQINPTANQAPAGSWTQSPSGTLQPYTQLTFAVAASDPNGDELAYHWDVGDGSEVSVNRPNLVHTYTTSGLFQVSVVVSDMKGGTFTLTTTVDVNAEIGAWSQRVSGTTAEFQDGTASWQRVVAVNTAGEIAHSTDGSNWILLDLKAQQGVDALQLYDVYSEYGTFIAAGRERSVAGAAWEGCLYRSTDGAAWSRVHLGGSLLYHMERTNLRWVVVGENETMRQSYDDGLTWESVAFPASDHIQAIAYGNGTWFAMADRNNDRTYAFTSPDLVTWTEQTWAASFSNNKIARPAWFLNGQFYFGGFALGLQSLPDPTQAPTQELSGLDAEDLIFHEGQFFLAGRINVNGTQTGLLMKKVPGGPWSANLLPEGSRHRAVIPFQDRLIVVGSGGGIWQSGPISSPNYNGWWAWQLLNSFELGTEDDPMSDPFGSGLPNFYHYAVGNPPGGGASPFLPHPARDGSGGLLLRVPRSGIQPDVVYRVWRSTNLIDWDTEGVTILRDDADMLEACGSGPGPEGTEFLRFEADFAP